MRRLYQQRRQHLDSEKRDLENQIAELQYRLVSTKKDLQITTEWLKSQTHNKRRKRLVTSIERKKRALMKLDDIYWMVSERPALEYNQRAKKIILKLVLNHNSYDALWDRAKRAQKHDCNIVYYRSEPLPDIHYIKGVGTWNSRRIAENYKSNVRMFCRVILSDTKQQLYYDCVRERRDIINKMTFEDIQKEITNKIPRTIFNSYVLSGPNAYYLGVDFEKKWISFMQDFSHYPKDILVIILLYE